MKEDKETRRTFVKKIAYVAPLVLTLKAAPSFAQNGSGGECGGGDHPPKPPKHPRHH